MNQFDIVNKAVPHNFAREDPKMLLNMFGSNDLASFWLADMDFKIAEPILKEFQRLVDRGVFAYEFASGDVFNAIVDWNKKRHQLSLDNKSFIQISGVLTGIALLVRELTQPGDGILIQMPVYHQFARIIKSADRKVITNPLKIVDEHYQMDFDNLEVQLQSENVRIILICNPHNPVGRVWKKNELQQLAELADKYGLSIISDEIHSDIIYPGHRFNSIASLGASRHIALLGSPAKTFGMQSISNGYLYITDEALRNQIKGTVDSMYLGHGNAFTTFGTIAAFKYGGPWLDDLISYLSDTISWIQEYLQNELPMVKMFPVEGTYQVWLDFSELDLTADELKTIVVNKAKLALTPGNWFDRNGARFMRMNIASPRSRIQSAFKQLNLAINESI